VVLFILGLSLELHLVNYVSQVNLGELERRGNDFDGFLLRECEAWFKFEVDSVFELIDLFEGPLSRDVAIFDFFSVSDQMELCDHVVEVAVVRGHLFLG
jgi:hypothetical protein